MKYLIIATGIIASSSLFSMKTPQDSTDKHYIIFKNSLSTDDFDVPNSRIDLSDKGENIKNVDLQTVSFSPNRTHHVQVENTISLLPNEEITIPLTTKETSAKFDITFHASMQNGQSQPLKLNKNFGPLKFGDSIDMRLMYYSKDEKAIGLFCNDELVTFFPLGQKKIV